MSSIVRRLCSQDFRTFFRHLVTNVATSALLVSTLPSYQWGPSDTNIALNIVLTYFIETVLQYNEFKMPTYWLHFMRIAFLVSLNPPTTIPSLLTNTKVLFYSRNMIVALFFCLYGCKLRISLSKKSMLFESMVSIVTWLTESIITYVMLRIFTFSPYTSALVAACIACPSPEFAWCMQTWLKRTPPTKTIESSPYVTESTLHMGYQNYGVEYTNDTGDAIDAQSSGTIESNCASLASAVNASDVAITTNNNDNEPQSQTTEEFASAFITQGVITWLSMILSVTIFSSISDGVKPYYHPGLNSTEILEFDCGHTITRGLVGLGMALLYSAMIWLFMFCVLPIDRTRIDFYAYAACAFAMSTLRYMSTVTALLGNTIISCVTCLRHKDEEGGRVLADLLWKLISPAYYVIIAYITVFYTITELIPIASEAYAIVILKIVTISVLAGSAKMAVTFILLCRRQISAQEKWIIVTNTLSKGSLQVIMASELFRRAPHLQKGPFAQTMIETNLYVIVNTLVILPICLWCLRIFLKR